MRTLRIGIAALLLIVAALVQALAPIPSPTGYLTDQTGVVEPEIMVQVQMRLAKYEVKSGRKIVVLLVPATPGEELEAYADRVLAAWKVGEAKGGGALLLWTAEGYILIRSIGPALDKLSGEAQSDILSRWVVPEFAEGRGGAGIRNGVERMIAVLDGEAVGFPPDAQMDTSGDAPDEMSADEGSLASDAEGDPFVDSQPLPALFESMPQDIERLVQGVSRDPGQGLKDWFGEAGSQIGQLDVLVPALLLQLRGQTVEPPFTPTQVGAYFVLIGAVVIAGIMLMRGGLVAGLMVLGFGCGAALWVATGFTALALILFGLGVLAPVLAPMLRAVFRGADDSERDAEPVHPLLKPKPAARAATVRAATARPATPSQTLSVRSANATNPGGNSLPPRLQHLEPVLKVAGERFRAELGKLRWVHAVAGFALFVFAPFLAVLALLGGAAFLIYRSGIAWLLSELIQDPQLKSRLRARLPRPEGAPKS